MIENEEKESNQTLLYIIAVIVLFLFICSSKIMCSIEVGVPEKDTIGTTIQDDGD